jgi:release factor glutamine methyltransferase
LVDDTVRRLRAAGCVFAEDEARLLRATARTSDELARLVDQRVGGMPLEYVLGWAKFCSRRIAVDRGVFAPRRRSEFLVRKAAALARGLAAYGHSPVVLLDLCCGSGAIGLAIADAVDATELHAVDVDPTAVSCARRNLVAVAGHVYEGDLYAPLPASLRGRVNLLVANAPYVPTDAISLLPREARLYEAPLALDGGVDGLAVVRRVLGPAREWLAPDGSVLVETSDHQVSAVKKIMAQGGLNPRVTRSDRLGATVVIGSNPISARTGA